MVRQQSKLPDSGLPSSNATSWPQAWRMVFGENQLNVIFRVAKLAIAQWQKNAIGSIVTSADRETVALVNQLVDAALKDHPSLTEATRQNDGLRTDISKLEQQLAVKDQRIEQLETRLNSRLHVQDEKINTISEENQEIKQHQRLVLEKARTLEGSSRINYTYHEIFQAVAVPLLRWIGLQGRKADAVADHSDNATPPNISEVDQVDISGLDLKRRGTERLQDRLDGIK